MKTFIQISHLQPLPDGKTCALPSIDNYPFGCVVVQKKLNKCKRPSQIHHHRRDGIGFFSPSPRPGHEVPSEIHASMSAIYRSHWQRMFCPALSWSQATSLFSSDHELGLMRQTTDEHHRTRGMSASWLGGFQPRLRLQCCTCCHLLTRGSVGGTTCLHS